MLHIHKATFILLMAVAFTHAQETVKLPLAPVEGFVKAPSQANVITPTGVAVNSKGHLFVVNAGPNKLIEFDTNGNFVRALGQGILVVPHGLRIDKDDNIWVTDLEQHLVLKLNSEGRVVMVLGQKGNKGEFDKERQMALFYMPADVAFGKNDEIYVADGYGNSHIVKFDKHGNFIKAWGQKGTAEGEFDNPHNIIVDNKGLVYVADRNNKRIQIFDTDGNFKRSWTHLGKPWGLALSKNQDIFMTDGTNEKVYKLDLKGNILGTYGSPGSQYSQFRAAHGISIDASENIYVTEILNWRVQKLQLVKK